MVSAQNCSISRRCGAYSARLYTPRTPPIVGFSAFSTTERADFVWGQRTLARLRFVDVAHRQRKHRVRGHEPGSLCTVKEPLQDTADLARRGVEALVLLAPDDGAHVLGGDLTDRLGADGRNDGLVEAATGNREVLPVLGHHFPEEAFAEFGHGGVRHRPFCLASRFWTAGDWPCATIVSRLSRSARASLSDSAG